MTWLKENWFKLTLLVFIIIGFYWYAIIPSQVRKTCAEKVYASEQEGGLGGGFGSPVYEAAYRACLNKFGIVK